MKTIYFISANEHKIEEVKSFFASRSPLKNFTVDTANIKIDEIQHKDMEEIVKEKAVTAYKKLRRPVFVEQTGLLIKRFGDLPGGLTQVFWDSLHAEKFAEFFVSRDATEVIAKTIIAYCDGRTIRCFEGKTEGTIVEPKQAENFQWDCVFQPGGSQKTFAEMDLLEKNTFSMREKALKKFADYLEEDHD